MGGEEGELPLPGDWGVRNISCSWTRGNSVFELGLGSCRAVLVEHQEAAFQGHGTGTVTTKEMAFFSDTPWSSLDTPAQCQDLVACVQCGSAGGGPALNLSLDTSHDLVGLL